MTADRPDPASSHLRQEWINVAQNEGRLAAHGDGDRESFECILLRAWCQIQPGIRGGSVDLLVWFFEQAREREELRCDIAEDRIIRMVWPLFKERQPRTRILAAAERANDNVLPAAELHAVINWVCVRATRPRRRA